MLQPRYPRSLLAGMFLLCSPPDFQTDDLLTQQTELGHGSNVQRESSVFYYSHELTLTRSMNRRTRNDLDLRSRYKRIHHQFPYSLVYEMVDWSTRCQCYSWSRTGSLTAQWKGHGSPSIHRQSCVLSSLKNIFPLQPFSLAPYSNCLIRD